MKDLPYHKGQPLYKGVDQDQLTAWGLGLPKKDFTGEHSVIGLREVFSFSWVLIFLVSLALVTNTNHYETDAPHPS